jgi:3-keto-L-gulonate-6-phosphate decarboxylase
MVPRNESATNGTARLDTLRKREQALKLSIAAELERERKRQARQRDRLVGIVGSALIDEANRSQNVKTMLSQILTTAIVDEKSRQFLSGMNWL